MTVRLLSLVAILAAAVAAPHAAPAGEPIPLGHKDFYPSPERPVGFRGDGNGWFPGATPVSEWWEGTPAQKDVEYLDRGQKRTRPMWQFADNTAKNIVWKTEMPGWANTQPIVVGDRIFTYGEPDLLICVDAHTGKILWTRTVNPWLLAGVEEKTAETCRQLYHAMLAVEAVIGMQFHFNTCGRYLTSDQYRPIVQAFVEKDLPGLLKQLKQIDPDGQYDEPAKALAAALIDSVDKFGATGKGNWDQEKKLKGRGYLYSALKSRIATLGPRSMPLDVPWGNMVGWCMAAPVSDGKHVFVSLGQGQTACFDLDGNMVWGRWFEQDKVSTHHVLSPLLAGDILIDMHGGGTLRGLDKKTGKTVWEAPTSREPKSKKGGYYIASHRAMKLNGVDLIVTSQCNIIRARDGKVLGFYDYGEAYGGGCPVAGWDDIIVKGANGDGWDQPFKAFRLAFDGPEKVVATELWAIGKGQYETRVVMPGATLICDDRNASIVETATGKVLHKGRGLGGTYRLVAGNLLISSNTGSNDRLTSHWSIRRPDGLTLMPFTTVDLSDPASPQTLSDRNLMGGVNHPRMPGVEQFIPACWAQGEFFNAKGGKPAHFMNTDTCIFPQGNRLFLRSVSHLYSIGDPGVKYDGPPARK